MLMMIDHVAFAVRDLRDALRVYAEVLGLELECEELVEEQKAMVAVFPIGDVKIELLQSTDPDGPVGRFIEKRGEGMHHIAFRVDDIEATLEELRAKGLRLIDDEPRIGAGGAKIAFIHPKSTNGVLIELVER